MAFSRGKDDFATAEAMMRDVAINEEHAAIVLDMLVKHNAMDIAEMLGLVK